MLIHFEVLDSITESMAVINTSGNILFTNIAWRKFSSENDGDNSKTGINTNYLNTCATAKGAEIEMATSARDGIQQVIDGKRDNFELEYPCDSPTQARWFILRASNILSYPELTLLAHINITERKIAELELAKNYNKSLVLNERLNTTLHKIAHDIQDPLSGIIGLIDLSKSEEDIETIKEYLKLIQEGSSDLSAFVKETLKQISASDAISSVKVENMLTKYMDSIKVHILSNAIQITMDVSQKGKFYTNAIEFRSVLSNLISNAIKYADDLKSEKTIDIHFRSDAKGACLKVKDNGLGIKEDDIPKIMQRSYQVNKESKAGVGLGLFMVERSLDILEGTLKINSVFGKGSEFIVEIPNRI